MSFSQAANRRMFQRKMAVCWVLGRHGEVRLGGLGKDIVPEICHMTLRSRASVPRRRMQAGIMWKEMGLPGRATLETEDGGASECATCTYGRLFCWDSR